MSSGYTSRLGPHIEQMVAQNTQLGIHIKIVSGFCMCLTVFARLDFPVRKQLHLKLEMRGLL